MCLRVYLDCLFDILGIKYLLVSLLFSTQSCLIIINFGHYNKLWTMRVRLEYDEPKDERAYLNTVLQSGIY